MNAQEVAKFLAVASGFDNRRVDDLMVKAWSLVPEVRQATPDDALAIMVAHFGGSAHRDYFTVGVFAEAWRRMHRANPRDIESDVRSAKARGIAPADWPPTKMLPPDWAAQLREARASTLKALES